MSGSVRLRRPWYARAFGGHVFQPFIAFALLLEFGLVIGLAVAGVDVSGAVNPSGVAGTAVWLVIWLVGVTGWASADDDAVRWRFWSPARIVPWSDVSAVVLRARLVGNGARPTIEIRLMSGRQLRVSAANDCGSGRIAFAQTLVDAARDRGIEVAFDPNDRRWSGIR